jgi:hypothetical protein
MTPIQLRTRVLQRLGVLAAGEPPNPDDGQVVAQKYAIVHDYLLEKGIVSWSIDEDVPDSVSIPVINIVAYACSSEFGITGPMLGQLAIEGALDADPVSLGERQLRKQQSQNYISEPAESEYF